jgi:hypothetical protein
MSLTVPGPRHDRSASQLTPHTLHGLEAPAAV